MYKFYTNAMISFKNYLAVQKACHYLSIQISTFLKWLKKFDPFISSTKIYAPKIPGPKFR